MTNPESSILFVCIHNSARSQMAEAFLNKYGAGKYKADSAGLEAGKMNPNVVKVMHEVGIDLSRKGTKTVSDLQKTGAAYDTVITVCDGQMPKNVRYFPAEGEELPGSSMILQVLRDRRKKFCSGHAGSGMKSKNYSDFIKKPVCSVLDLMSIN